ncbi:hypothetical protein [Thermosulfurimonas dismutans]|uniref:Rrf2 family transcriptional regulator n=1 Tax=Thermosulfurimonas dismutans TaxID=999894 RepID=A0A179D4B2_9BACT|nr:hypothetical protein [Thermosulfurimonas dismutans]OAQ20924.1 hypothetical protein TDIS_1051 [Thermosulfurimonas dismutans]
MEREDEVTPCVAYPEVCEFNEICPTREVWDRLTELIKETLSQVTLADLAQKYQERLTTRKA